MIRKLLATTALVTFAASGLHAAETKSMAQDQTKAMTQTSDRYLTSAHDETLASKLIGETVYVSSAADAETVGDINDLLVGSDGEIDAAIIGVGGFLGIGEKNVAVNYDQLNLTTANNGEYRVVLETSKQELENAPAFDVQAAVTPEQTGNNQANNDAMAAKPKTANDQMASANKDAMANKDQMAADQSGMASKDQMAADQNGMATKDQMANDKNAMSAKDRMAANEPMANQPAATGDTGMTGNRQNYGVVDAKTMGTDKILGANVYSYKDENLGEIGEVIVNDNGKIDAVVIDVGGFLGIGEKPVAVAFDDLEFREDKNGTLYVYTQFTSDQLDQAPKYDEEQYKQNPDQMLLRSSG